MPSLADLVKEVDSLDVDPDKVMIGGELYDDLVEIAEELADED